jgi:hypothetical protein
MSFIQFDCLSKGTSIISTLPKDPDDVESPTVYFTAVALETIRYIVQECNDEIAWLGLVDELTDGNFLITEIFVPKQEVTSTSVDIAPEAMNVLAHQLIVAGKDPGKLRYHGHSHVNMQVHPSQTDQDHMRDYLEHPDWFIRSIHNKKGDVRVDVYDKRTMLVHHNVEHENWDLIQPQEFYDALDAILNDQISRPPRRLVPLTVRAWDQRFTQQPNQNARDRSLANAAAERQALEDAYYNSFNDDDDIITNNQDARDRVLLNRFFGLDDDDQPFYKNGKD